MCDDRLSKPPAKRCQWQLAPLNRIVALHTKCANTAHTQQIQEGLA